VYCGYRTISVAYLRTWFSAQTEKCKRRWKCYKSLFCETVYKQYWNCRGLSEIFLYGTPFILCCDWLYCIVGQVLSYDLLSTNFCLYLTFYYVLSLCPLGGIAVHRVCWLVDLLTFSLRLQWHVGIPISDPFSQSRDSGLGNF